MSKAQVPESIILKLKIDLTTYQITKEIKTNKPYSYLTLLDNGDVLLTYSRDGTSLKQIVDKYNFKKNKISSFIKTHDYYPSVVIPYEKNYFVLLGAHHSGDLILELYNNEGTYKKSFLLSKHAMCIYGSEMLINSKKIVLFFLKEFDQKENDSFPKLISFNLETHEIRDVSSHFKKQLSSIDAVSLDFVKNKLFISPLTKGRPSGDLNEKPKRNKDVYIYSYPDFKLLNKIPTVNQPGYLVSFSKYNKLYVSHGLSVSVIDSHTETLLETLPFYAKRIEKVADDKLMIWHY